MNTFTINIYLNDDGQVTGTVHVTPASDTYYDGKMVLIDVTTNDSSAIVSAIWNGNRITLDKITDVYYDKWVLVQAGTNTLTVNITKD